MWRYHSQYSYSSQLFDRYSVLFHGFYVYVVVNTHITCIRVYAHASTLMICDQPAWGIDCGLFCSPSTATKYSLCVCMYVCMHVCACVYMFVLFTVYSNDVQPVCMYVFVCMRVCIYVYTTSGLLCMYLCMHACLYACICACMYVYIRVYNNSRVDRDAADYFNVCYATRSCRRYRYRCMFVCMYACMYVYVCVYINSRCGWLFQIFLLCHVVEYIHTYTYIHAYMHACMYYFKFVCHAT
jgi:hypothetical protein